MKIGNGNESEQYSHGRRRYPGGRLEQKAELQLNLKIDVLVNLEDATRHSASRRRCVHEIPERHEKLARVRLNDLRGHARWPQHALEKA